MSECSCGGKDQTKEAVFDFLEQRELNSLNRALEIKGIGVFLVPAPEIGILEYKTIDVEDLTYVETVKRGNNCVAFQWVPNEIIVKLHPEMEITVTSKADLETLRAGCGGRCKASGCQMGCFCYSTDTGFCRMSP